MQINLRPIAYVSNSRSELIDDHWSSIESTIKLIESIPETALEGIDAFSHLNIIFFMDQVLDEKAIPQFRHPRNNTELPRLGTYAQRNKNRPNKLGLTCVELIRRNGNHLIVKNLDAIDGTPILDIKPVMVEFQPKGQIVQPDWTKEIMKSYW